MAELPIDLTRLVDEHPGRTMSRSGIVAVARGGELLDTVRWGDDGYDEDAPFRIASCTKSFTALSLLALRRAGRLRLDDPVREHVPELTLDTPTGWPELRLIHLLGMSGGLATDNPWGDRQESCSRAELLGWLSGGVRLIFPPGAAYEYSNLGYAVLGEVIARASGREYREFVTEEIIRPMGLTRTRFAAQELEAVVAGYHREPPYIGVGSGWSPQPQPGPGAFSAIGGLYSTVRDLARWAELFLLREAPAGAVFGSAELLEAQQTITPIGCAPAPAPLTGTIVGGYGAGLRIESSESFGKLVSHAGGYPGFTAYMCWHERSGYAVIASANGSHSTAPAMARQVMFDLIAAAPGEPDGAEPVEVWPETRAAVDKLTAAVSALEASGRDPNPEASELADLFAMNVDLDFPVHLRMARLRDALVTLGAATTASAGPLATFERPSRARWELRHEKGRLELQLEMTPVRPFRVQTFSAVALLGDQRVKLF